MTVIYKTRGQLRPSPVSFITQAERQLEFAERAVLQGDVAQAVTFAYRAALRAAGALIDTGKRGRKRLPEGSAWRRLQFLRPDLQGWVNTFERHARLVARVDAGLGRELSMAACADLLEDAGSFVGLSRANLGLGMRAA